MGMFLKKGLIYCVVAMLVLLSCGLCFAFGGKVSYPDGAPAVGAAVSVVGSNGVEQTTTCNANGQFQIRPVEGDAKIQIKAPDGKNYAPVVLPATVFGSGETAIVLQQN